MKRKLILIAAAFCFIFLMSGCATTKIDCGIDDEYNAYLNYEFEVDCTDMPDGYWQGARNALDQITDHYKTLGFKTQILSKNGPVYVVTMDYSIAGKDYQSAFDNLKRILTNPKMTPFLTATMSYAETEYEKVFSFDSTLDFSKIIETAHYEQLPTDVRTFFEEERKRFTGEITITLPASEYISENSVSSDNIFHTASADIDLDTPVQLSLKTHLNPWNVYKTTDQTLNDFVFVRNVVLGICAIPFILTVVFFILRIRKPKVKAGAAINEKIDHTTVQNTASSDMSITEIANESTTQNMVSDEAIDSTVTDETTDDIDKKEVSADNAAAKDEISSETSQNEINNKDCDNPTEI